MESVICPVYEHKKKHANDSINCALRLLDQGEQKPMNAIWLEATGCSGNIISFTNGENPNLTYILERMIKLRYNNTLMQSQGENAYKQLLDTLETEFILIIEGAVSVKDNGNFNIIAKYKGKKITALETVIKAAERAKYVVAVGTCACYGGISAAAPNPSECKSVKDILGGAVIRVPGCPTHPDWIIGTLAQLVGFGMPELDEDGRPVMFYGTKIHDICTRRGYFDKKVFAKNFGDRECMFKLGCRGPVTKTDCPTRKWNGSVNWPIGNNTNCIGCAQPYFPDGMEPFDKNV